MHQYIYVYVTNTHAYTYIHTNIHVYMYIYPYIYTYICIHIIYINHQMHPFVPTPSIDLLAYIKNKLTNAPKKKTNEIVHS